MIYLCIDLKSFYASVECVMRGLDPMTTNLVVADPSRGKGAICLAITPALKKLGIRNRCRLYEIPSNVHYIIALPKMQDYIDYSADIYQIYLKYIAKEDIHPYSIDEMFMDITPYLSLYNMTARQLAKVIIDDILKTTGISATAGIGTNLYLTKIALDILAKHSPDGIGYLDEELYKERLFHHLPLTDFWQIGKGTEKRLNKLGIIDIADLANYDFDKLYKVFGINAKILYDHAQGIEPTTIKDIKRYKSKSNSIGHGQILFRNYKYEEAITIVKEMVDQLCLELNDLEVVTSNISLAVGYSDDTMVGSSQKLAEITNLYSTLIEYALDLYMKIVDPNKLIRRINISFNQIKSLEYETFSLFTNYELAKKEKELIKTVNALKTKYGKNKVLKGINYLEESTAKIRNTLIGGHNNGKED